MVVAGHLKMTRGRLLATMALKEFFEWRVFLRETPAGLIGEDARHSLLCSTLAGIFAEKPPAPATFSLLRPPREAAEAPRDPAAAEAAARAVLAGAVRFVDG